MIEVTLPGGFERDGAWRRSVWLRPWCGRDEAFFAEDAAASSPAVPAARTTALLARCLALDPDATPAPPDLVRALNAGDREALLLHLRRLTLGERLSSVLACPECGERMDLDLRIGDLLLPPSGHEGSFHDATVSADGEVFHVRFRLPTGGDLEDAAALARRDAEAAAREVLRRCVDEITTGDGAPVDGLPEAVARQLPRLMAERDPQAELRLDMECPACGATFATIFDTAQYLHQEIVQGSDQLYREVHQLALHYHWSEPEILALSARQRRRYLGLLAETLAERRAR